MQMSYWGATVITNLASSIPWIGTDQVELINLIYNRDDFLNLLIPFGSIRTADLARIKKIDYAAHLI